jgi:hypothetical protein
MIRFSLNKKLSSRLSCEKSEKEIRFSKEIQLTGLVILLRSGVGAL